MSPFEHMGEPSTAPPENRDPLGSDAQPTEPTAEDPTPVPFGGQARETLEASPSEELTPAGETHQDGGTPRDQTKDVDAPEHESWTGSVGAPYAVGDPGRAASEVTPALPRSPHDPADTQLDGGTHGSLVIRAASTRGTSHRHSGTPRQDEYALSTCGDDWLVAAVADGVSAGELSHLAAALAARGAAEFVRDRLLTTRSLEAIPWTEMLSELAGRIVLYGQRRLNRVDEMEPSSAAEVARSMATTLVVLVLGIQPGADGRRHGCVLAMGDTSVFQLDSSGAWGPVTSVKNAGAAISTSATAALPYLPSSPLEPIPVEMGAGEGLFVMTDGVGDPLGAGTGVVGDFLASVWSEPPELLAFGAQVGFARRSYDDDRTVIGIWSGR